MDCLFVRSTVVFILLQTVILFNASILTIASDPIIRIKLTGTEYSDETIMRFKIGTTTNFDFQYDANKIMSGGATPSIYSTINTTMYSINSIPSPDSLPVIQIGSQINETSSYTLSFANSTGLHGYTLYDKFLDTEIAIDSSTIYSFDALIGEDLMRFELRYTTTTNNRNAAITNVRARSTSNIVVGSCADGMSLIFKNYNPENYTIKIIGQGGRILKLVQKENITTLSNSQYIDLSDLSAGNYVVLIEVDNSESSYHISLL